MVTTFCSGISNELIASSDPLEMYSLNTWVSNINVEKVVKDRLESVNMPKRLLEGSLLKTNIIEEIQHRYSGWYKLYTDASKSNNLGVAYFDPAKKVYGIFEIESSFYQ